jgi:hypothetical protein
VPGKLVAFSGPAVRPTDYVGFRAMVPEDYWDYWHKRGVQAIVRLNKKVRQCMLTWPELRICLEGSRRQAGSRPECAQWVMHIARNNWSVSNTAH